MAGKTSVPNLSSFSPAQLQALLAAAQAEILQRLTGRVQSGSSAGQNFAMNQYTTDELNRLVNALTSQLGLDTEMTFVRPNFAGAGLGSGYGTAGPLTGGSC